MRGLLTLVVAAVLIGVLLKGAGVDLPVIDYPIGPFGGDLVRPEVEIQAPGFNEFPQP